MLFCPFGSQIQLRIDSSCWFILVLDSDFSPHEQRWIDFSFSMHVLNFDLELVRSWFSLHLSETLLQYISKVYWNLVTVEAISVQWSCINRSTLCAQTTLGSAPGSYWITLSDWTENANIFSLLLSLKRFGTWHSTVLHFWTPTRWRCQW